MRINSKNIESALEDILSDINCASMGVQNESCATYLTSAQGKIGMLLTLIDFEDEDKNMERPQPKTGVIEYR